MDWSSDVCSSDLMTRRAAADPVRSAHWLGHHRSIVTGRLSSFGIANDKSFPHAKPFSLGPVAPDIRRAGAKCVSHRVDRPRPSLIEADRSEVGLAGAIARSEEHTSELQSLMRISYAVFCMKANTRQAKT